MDYASFFLVPGRRKTMPHKRWRMALTIIYTCRAFAKKHLSAVLLRSPSYVAIDVRDAAGAAPDPLISFAAARKSSFACLVKEKQYDSLQRLGGAAAIAAALLSDAEHGIAGDPSDLRRRREAFGSNTYPKPKPKSFFVHVVDALGDVFLLVLVACAAVSLGFGIKEHGIKSGWYDGASIFLAVFLVVAVSAFSNHRQSQRFDRLAGECDNIDVTVVRDSRRSEVSIFDIMVGDVVILKIGDQVPADGVFLAGHSLQLDESSMTGESDPVYVGADENPLLSSGAKVVDGYASMLVTAVGTDTAWGEMMGTITRETTEPTPLQERLSGLTSSIGKAGIAVAVLVFAVLLTRYFTGNTEDENGQPEFDKRHVSANSVVSALVGIFQQAVTIIVVAIPEGLPLAVTLTLAFSMKRMMQDNALVRTLSACETMGSVTAVCTDKTGTLTLNQMKVTQFWIGGGEQIEIGGSGKGTTAADTATAIAGTVLGLFHQGVGLNTTGSVYKAGPLSELEISGSPTEKALLCWAAAELKMDAEELKKSYKVIHVEAFNSEKKRSGVLIKENYGRGTVIAHWKGAAEMIMARCVKYFDSNGMIQELGIDQRVKSEQVIKGMAASSLRCIAFACKQIEAKDSGIQAEAPKLEDDGLVLLGLVGLKDPCRPEVKSAIRSCRDAGVAVKMITGDNIFTARAIAKECGIIQDDDYDGLVIEGQEFRNYSAEERMERVDRIRVMARSSPFDKLLVVQCLKQKGHVVAVTGDGTNDAPALKEADVGLSMGIQGTEVAKESSDIIILDDNFDTVVTVMRWGRCVYNNIQKFIQFQLTVNIAALVINFVAAVSSGKVPLTTVQLLWVNLIMDTMGALALATDRPTKELMKKPPVGRTEPLISNVMWRNLLAQAVFQVAVLLIFQFAGQAIFGVSEKINNTLIFNTFVLCQVFNEFNSRKLEKKNVFEGILTNKLFLGIIGVTIVLQVIMVELLTRFADTQRLNWGQWGICVGIAAISWPIGWIVKCVPVSSTPVHQLLTRCKAF
ncbi:putative calcium-transporting ATPase 13, plasma membrane-type [Ananas comosus]|uniref:Calcium-transporting ATPase n=1 Tax=Ananas comosus TaxID=4615 RepID=A0A6P5G910_ANACO|nr:putative calcium-transporting ATPase 13, plasma membrane-type [Ananas comosus]